MGFRTPPTHWTNLKRQIEEHAITRAAKGVSFALSNGTETNYHLDMAMIPLLHGSAAKECGRSMVDLIPGEYRYVGTYPLGGLLLLPMIIGNRSNQLSGFFVRPETHAAGSSKSIEGVYGSDAPAVMITDIVNTGLGLADAITIARGAGINVDLALALFDRQNGADKTLSRIGVEFRSVFKPSDFDL